MYATVWQDLLQIQRYLRPQRIVGRIIRKFFSPVTSGPSVVGSCQKSQSSDDVSTLRSDVRGTGREKEGSDRPHHLSHRAYIVTEMGTTGALVTAGNTHHHGTGQVENGETIEQRKDQQVA